MKCECCNNEWYKELAWEYLCEECYEKKYSITVVFPRIVGGVILLFVILYLAYQNIGIN